MAQFIVSYDLQKTDPPPHSAFILQAKARGWDTFIHFDDGTKNKLPNTTLVGHFQNLEEAIENFLSLPARTSVVTRGPVVLEKYVVTSAPRTESASDEH